MADFQGTSGKDKLIGTDGEADVFSFMSSDIQSGDKIKGGGGNSDPEDRLIISSGGHLDLRPFFLGDRNGVAGIEHLVLSDSTNSLRLTREFIDASSTGEFTITGGAGRDVLAFSEPDFDHPYQRNKLVFYGGGGNDLIRGNAYYPKDECYGGGGNDTLIGSFAVAFGGSGNDSLGVADDGELRGGSGNDLIYLPESGAYINGGAGMDYIAVYKLAYLSSNTLVSIEGLNISSVECSLSELAGFDRIKGGLQNGAASFWLDGGGSFDFTTLTEAPQIVMITAKFSESDYSIIGVDTGNEFFMGSGDDHITGGDANDIMAGGSGDDEVAGGGGSDMLGGGEGSDVLRGGSGDDMLEPYNYFLGRHLSSSPLQGDDARTADFDFLYGEGGNDTIGVSAYSGLIDGGTGIDRVLCVDDLRDIEFINVEILKTDRQRDSLTATVSQIASFQTLLMDFNVSGETLKDLIVVGGGTLDLRGKFRDPSDAIRIIAGSSDDFTLIAATGNDVLYDGSRSDVLMGKGGNDKIYLTFDRSVDSAFGGNGNDRISSGERFNPRNLVYGGSGNDTFSGVAAFFDGGSGFDTIEASNRLYDIELKSIEKLLVTSSNFELIASVKMISSFKEIEYIESDATDRRVLVLTGNGSIDFTNKVQGHGLDVFFKEYTTGADITGSDFGDAIRGTEYADSIGGGEGDDFLQSNEGDDIVMGGDGDDQLYGGNGDDIVNGGSGNDGISGESGTDKVIGGLGDDNLGGGAGRDVVIGGLGDDSLGGGTGHDVLIGGAGDDRFFFDYFSYFGDVIDDFSSKASGNDDQIFIASSMIDPGSVIGLDGTGAIVKSCFQSSSSAVAANKAIRFIYDEDDGNLYYDLDGSGLLFSPVLLAKLLSAPNLTAADFVIF